MYVSTTLYYTT